MARLGVIFYPFPDTSVKDFLHYAAETGFAAVELNVGCIWQEKGSDRSPYEDAERVREMLDERGLVCSALSSGNDFVVLEEEEIQAQVARMEQIIELAGILGAGAIRTEGGQPKDSVPEEKWADAIAECLRRLVDDAERAGIGLAVDNHGVVTNADGILEEVFRQVTSPIVGSNLDTFNWRWYGHSMEKVKELWDVCIPRVLHTHLKDGVGARADYDGRILGEGEGEVAEAVRRLKAAGYDGVWCAECEAAMDSRTAYKGCLAWMEENI